MAYSTLLDTVNSKSAMYVYDELTGGQIDGVEGFGVTVDSSNTILIPSIAQPHLFSVSLWFNTVATGASQTIMHKCTTDSEVGGTGFIIKTAADGSANFSGTFISDGTDWYKIADSTTDLGIFDGLWHNVILVHTGSTLLLYLDGGEIASANLLTSAGIPSDVSNTANLVIGNGMNGEVDEFLYFDYALSGSQATDLYSALGTEYQMAGAVTQDGVFVERIVRVYRRDTGQLVKQMVSTGGTFDIRLRDIYPNREYIIMAVDDDIVPILNPIAYDRVVPVPV